MKNTPKRRASAENDDDRHGKRHSRRRRSLRHSNQEWRATRLIDERTGNSYVGIDFPTRLGSVGFEVVDEDIVEQPAKVRLLLKKRGAALNGSKKDQIRFVGKLLSKLADEPLMLAMKPGFRGDGFVLGNCARRISAMAGSSSCVKISVRQAPKLR